MTAKHVSAFCEGGSWFSYPEFATICFRNFELPKTRRRDYGFRCVRGLDRQ